MTLVEFELNPKDKGHTHLQTCRHTAYIECALSLEEEVVRGDLMLLAEFVCFLSFMLLADFANTSSTEKINSAGTGRAEAERRRVRAEKSGCPHDMAS